MIVCIPASDTRELKTSACSASSSDCPPPSSKRFFQSEHLCKEIISDWTSLTVICFGVCELSSFVKMSSFPLMCNARHTRDHFNAMSKEKTREEKTTFKEEPLPPFRPVMDHNIQHITLLNTSVDQWKATKTFLQNTAEQLVQSVSKFTPGNHH